MGRLKNVSIASMFLAAGCGAPAKQSNEVSFHLPSRVVAAGTQGMSCWYTTMPLDSDVFASQFITEQAPGGHHIAVFTTDESDVPDGTIVDCSGPDSMTHWRPLLIGIDKAGFSFPPGYAVRVPGKVQIVVQSHYVNATPDDLTTDDSVRIVFSRSQDGLTLVGTSSQTTVDFNIAPNSTFNSTFDCAVTQPMQVFTLFGHMHEWGSHLTLSAGPAAAPATVYDVAWQPSYRDHPPAVTPGFDAPLVLAPGDVIRTSCTWNNTESTALAFPNEMCASVLWFFPADQSLVCVRPSASN